MASSLPMGLYSQPPTFVLCLFCLLLLLGFAAPTEKDVLIKLDLGTLEPKQGLFMAGAHHWLQGCGCGQGYQTTTAAAHRLQDIIGETFPVDTAQRPTWEGFLEGTGQVLSVTL